MAVLILPAAFAWAAGTNGVVPLEAAELSDIKQPLRIGSAWTWGMRIGAILALTALLGLAWWWWQRTRPPVAGEDSAGLTPDERARQRLDEARRWLDQPERLATEVSLIVRQYLEERFGLHAPERTTEEFLNEMARSVALESRHKGLLGEFLTQCDLVKFARLEPDRGTLEQLHGAALRLVEETTPTGAPGKPPEISGWTGKGAGA